MLTAINAQQKKCIAWQVEKKEKPFYCPKCNGEVILKKGNVKIHHFAHKSPISCAFGVGESQQHMLVKKNIYEALLKEPNCTKCELERTTLNGVRPDISLKINNSYVAIEIQHSTIDIETIIQRFQRYSKLNIYLIWILTDNKPKIVSRDLKDENFTENICRPKDWEKYLHAMYFGRLYYWQYDAFVKPFHLNSYQYKIDSGNWIEENEELMELEGTNWYEDNIDLANYGGTIRYSKSKKEFLVPKKQSKEILLNLARDFKPTKRAKTTFHNIKYPEAKLWIDKLKKWW